MIAIGIEDYVMHVADTAAGESIGNLKSSPPVFGNINIGFQIFITVSVLAEDHPRAVHADIHRPGSALDSEGEGHLRFAGFGAVDTFSGNGNARAVVHDLEDGDIISQESSGQGEAGQCGFVSR